MIATSTHKYESIYCSDILLFVDSHEFDHVFSFNGFLEFTKLYGSTVLLDSSADGGEWVVCLLVEWSKIRIEIMANLLLDRY